MPGSSKALIVGGGIQPVTIAIDEFLYVVTVSPPAASSSPRLVRRATSIEILGDGAFSTAIGNNADANGDEAIVIGRDCSQTGVGANSDIIVIGQNVDHTGVGGQQAIVIGNNTSLSGGSLVFIGSTGSALGAAGSFVAIGTGVSVSGTFNGVLIGNGAASNGGNAVAIGGSGASAATGGVTVGCGSTMNSSTSNNIMLGQGQTISGATSSQCILIGQACLTNTANVIFIGANLRTDNGVYASGDVVIGNNNTGGGGFSSRVIWFGDTHTSGTAVPAAAMRWKNAAGTNIAAGDLTITGPRSTGNATPASVLLQVGITGASGTTLQTATTVLTLIGSANPAVRWLNSAGTIVTPTFGAAITIDNTLGDIQRIVANAATAPTIGAPSQNGVDGQYLTLIIRNASGGAMGATTFNAAYHLAGAWTNPANGTERTIKFRGNGAGVWYEEFRNTADVTT